MARTFVTLPEELILCIFGFLHRLDDLYSLMLTNKLLHHISHDVSANDISRLALNTGNFFPGLQPYQHMLLVPSARRLADWAVQSDDRRKQLASAMLGGIDGLVALAMQEAPITLDDIRKVWRWKQDILNPLSHEMDLACGRPSEPAEYLTVCEDPSLTLLIWVIWGELFHHNISYLYSHHNPRHPTPLDSINRFKFMVYCFPDVNAFSYMGLEAPAWFSSLQKSGDGFQQLGLNAALDYLLPSFWGREVNELVPGILNDHGDGDGDWNFEDYITKDQLFLSSVYSSGIRALDILQAGRLRRESSIEPTGELLVWLKELRAKVDALPEQRTETGDISQGEPYDPWLVENWVMLPWDNRLTLWDAGTYSLHQRVQDRYGSEDEAWRALKDLVGEDPLAPGQTEQESMA